MRGARILDDPVEWDEPRLAGGRPPDSLRGTVGQAKAARLADPRIEIPEQVGKHRFDLVADTVVVVLEGLPVDARIPQRGARHAADNGDLRFQLVTRRQEQPARSV